MIIVTAAIIRNADRILLTRRRADADLPDLWEFPGGKVEANESLIEALHREIREELGIEIAVGDEYYATTHHYPTKSPSFLQLHHHTWRASRHRGSGLSLGAAS